MYLKINCAIILLACISARTISAQISDNATVTQNVTIATANSTDGSQNTTGSSISGQDSIVTQNSTTVTENSTINLLADIFISSQIVPMFFPVAPSTLAITTFSNGLEAKLGKELTPTAVKDQPSVKWNAKTDGVYSLIMLDLDVPSRLLPTMAPLLHWMVVNIKGENLTSGRTLAQYIGAGPPRNSGPHRYVLLVFQQPSELVFNEPVLNNTSIARRSVFSIDDFVKKYSLTGPIAGNFFVSQFDSYVPKLYKQLGIASASTSVAVAPISLVFSSLIGVLCSRFY